MKTAKFCPAMWFSGFFALGAVVHLARYFLGISLRVGSSEISLTTSLILAVCLGALSAGLLAVSLKKTCDRGHESSKKEKGTCCGV